MTDRSEPRHHPQGVCALPPRHWPPWQLAIAPAAGFCRAVPVGETEHRAIGVGGMGAANLKACEAENIVALCDVDRDYAAKTFARYPKATVYTDYREMLEKQKDVDASSSRRPTTRTPRSRWPACRRASTCIARSR